MENNNNNLDDSTMPGLSEIWFQRLVEQESLAQEQQGTEPNLVDQLATTTSGTAPNVATEATADHAGSSGSNIVASRPSKRRRLLSDNKRLQRNSREQERSHRVSEQFSELRDLLSKSGIVIPKGTKNAVLGISMDYIRALQEQQKLVEWYVP